MAKPLSPGDQAKVGQFIGKMLRGVADVGMAAMPMISLYTTAKQTGVSIIDLALEDEDTMRSVVDAIGRRAERLPPPLLKLLERVVADAKRRQSPVMVPAEDHSDTNEDV